MQQLRRLNFFDRMVVQRPARTETAQSETTCNNLKSLVDGGGDIDACARLFHSGLSTERAGSAPVSPLPRSSIVCAAGTDTHLWLGDDVGERHLLNRDLQLTSAKVFDQTFLQMHTAADAHCVVCIGLDTWGSVVGTNAQQNTLRGVCTPTASGRLKYKCYSSTQVDALGSPVLLREAAVFSRIPEQRFMCSDVNRCFTMLAVGTESAGVCLFRGDLVRERTCRLRLVKDSDDQIRSVKFVSAHSYDTGEKIEYLIVCTQSNVTCYAVPLKGNPKACHVNPTTGVVSACCVSRMAATGKFLVHEGEGIFCVDPEQGNLWALPTNGPCHILDSYNSYVISIISTGGAGVGDSIDDQVEMQPDQHVNGSGLVGGMRQIINVYLCYPDLRLVAYSSPMTGICHVVSAMDTLLVICRGANDCNVLFEMRERSFDERLRILLRGVSDAVASHVFDCGGPCLLQLHSKRLFQWAEDVAIQEEQPLQVVQNV